MASRFQPRVPSPFLCCLSGLKTGPGFIRIYPIHQFEQKVWELQWPTSCPPILLGTSSSLFRRRALLVNTRLVAREGLLPSSLGTSVSEMNTPSKQGRSVVSPSPPQQQTGTKLESYVTLRKVQERKAPKLRELSLRPSSMAF